MTEPAPLDVVASPAEVAALTSEWAGERSVDGRPRVADHLLERLRAVTVERAWSTLRAAGYARQFDGGWQTTNPARPLVGRAFPVQFVPARPDLDARVAAFGERHGYRGGLGGQNSWVIDLLEPGDVLVVDAFGKVEDGPFIGDLLATSIRRRTGAGAVVDGTVRDVAGIREQTDLTVLHRGTHASYLQGATLLRVNDPVRIGGVTVFPGDAVLGTLGGVAFVPPALVERVVTRSEDVLDRDRFAKERLAAGTYAPGDVDRDDWNADIETDYQRWRAHRST